MIPYFKKKPQTLFFILLAVFAVLGILNLQILPIAWTDEVMNLDPALQWHKTGNYAGLLWPNKGASSLFLAYPPLIEFLHILSIYIFPFDIFWMRLPMLLFHLSAIILLYISIKKYSKDIWIGVVLCLLFMFDKVVFEISRSMRVEVLETFLVVLLFYLHYSKKSNLLKGLVLGFLITAHLKMWPFVLIWISLEWMSKESLKSKFVLAFVSIIPSLLFLIFIDFEILELYNQLFSQAEKHTSTGGFASQLSANLFGRFWPVYAEQVWVFPIHFYILISSVIQIFKTRFKVFAPVLFLGTYLAWMVFLAPHYRYWPPLYACGLFVMVSDTRFKNLFKQDKIKSAFIWLVPALMAGFLSRHAIAGIQHKSRSTKAVIEWLQPEIQVQYKTLIVGNAAAFYMSNQENIDYGMEMYPQNLHFDSYDKVFLLTADSVNLTPQMYYEIQEMQLPNWLKYFGKAGTYKGLKLYPVQSREQWKAITEKYEKDYAK